MDASEHRFAGPLAALALATALAILAGCDALYSDSEHALRQSRAEHKERVAEMQAATLGTAKGTAVAGDALRELLSGRTHVFVYQQTPGGQHVHYVEYDYFRPDGHFVFMNNLWAKNPAGHPGDHWKVDHSRLCILNTDYGRDEHCFRLAVVAPGRIQYFIDSPGSDTDGLLTKVTDAVQNGPPDLSKP